MDYDSSAKKIEPACLNRDEQCALCSGDNQCRIAKGHLYKGPCWCEEVVVPGHILRRLTEHQLHQVCICPKCLSTISRLAAEMPSTDEVIKEVTRTIIES